MTVILDQPEATPATPKRKRSGGPRTPEGKARSRRNALKHGLRAKFLLPDDMRDAIDAHTGELIEVFRPDNDYERWLFREMATATVRISQCVEESIADAKRCIYRAVHMWDHDRWMYVEALGKRLAKDPSGIVRALRGSRQGAEWLLSRWQMLGEVLDSRGDWTEEQRDLAFDLLGVPTLVRDGNKRLPAPGATAGLRQVVEEEMARLRQEISICLHDLDQSCREMAMAGMPFEEDATTARLRRYEASHRRALNWARTEFRRVRDSKFTNPNESKPSATPPLSNAASKYLVERAERVSAEERAQLFENCTPEQKQMLEEATAEFEAEERRAKQESGRSEQERRRAAREAEEAAERRAEEASQRRREQIEAYRARAAANRARKEAAEAEARRAIEAMLAEDPALREVMASLAEGPESACPPALRTVLAVYREGIGAAQAAVARAWVSPPVAVSPPTPEPSPTPAPGSSGRVKARTRRERRAAAKAARQRKGGGSPGSSR